MPQFAVDDNRNISAIRTGAFVGGFYNPTASGLNNDTWYRLMPSTDSASKVTNNNTSIDLGALRFDITGADISDWTIRILTSGYESIYSIAEYDATTEIARLDVYSGAGNISEQVARFPANFDALYFPKILLPLTLGYAMTDTASEITKALEIGYASENVLSPTPTRLVSLASGDQLILPIQQIDKIFFRFPVTDSANSGNALDDDDDAFSISWGEHYVS